MASATARRPQLALLARSNMFRPHRSGRTPTARSSGSTARPYRSRHTYPHMPASSPCRRCLLISFMGTTISEHSPSSTPSPPHNAFTTSQGNTTTGRTYWSPECACSAMRINRDSASRLSSAVRLGPSEGDASAVFRRTTWRSTEWESSDSLIISHRSSASPVEDPIQRWATSEGQVPCSGVAVCAFGSV